MCGFVGEISRGPVVEQERLDRMAQVLIHRGPDEGGLVMAPDRRWGVAHRRLCVIDPAGGKQPMRDPEHGLTLVYSGEIYDHDRLRQELAAGGYRFRTRSDTEVLLALYTTHGLGLFEHLRGEFAFALVDERRGAAILARDRMGLKPLFYVQTSGGWVFASEIKALFQSPAVRRALDPMDLVAAISIGDAPGRTIFEGVRQVRHAHYLQVRLDDLATSEHRYWDALECRRTELPAGSAEQIALVREEVDRAIHLRLRADVPVGVYLSGGLDSSLVAAVMAQRMERVDAFALAFVDSPRHDESAFAEQMARCQPRIHLHRIPITSADLVRGIPETVWHLERPFGNLHSVAKIIQSRYARRHVACVLTGDGGDEAFCGYSTFWLQQALQDSGYSLRAIRGPLRRMRREAAQIGGNRYYLMGGLALKIDADARLLVDKLGFPPCDLATALHTQRLILPLLGPEFRRRMEGSPVGRLIDDLSRAMPATDSLPHATLLQYVQLNSTVPQYIATMADRSEWAGSVEARPPLFDHKVIELAMGLPLAMKLQGDREKHVLREAYKDLVPPEIVVRRKQAFLAPPAPFQSPEGRALLDRYLNPQAVRDAGVWHPAKVAALRLARPLLPRMRALNVTLTVLLTVQILHEQFVAEG